VALRHQRAVLRPVVVAPAAQLLTIPDALSIREAALVEPTAVAMHAVTLSGATPDDRVLVTGGGPVGLLVTAVLHAQGIHDVTVSEPSAIRRQHALKVGAARVVEPHELPRSRMGAPVEEPYQVVFECSGRADAAESAIDQLDFAGTCVLVGTGHDLPRINHNRVIILENTIIGAYNYDAAGFGPALACGRTAQIMRFDTASGEQTEVSWADYQADRLGRPGVLTGLGLLSTDVRQQEQRRPATCQLPRVLRVSRSRGAPDIELTSADRPAPGIPSLIWRSVSTPTLGAALSFDPVWLPPSDRASSTVVATGRGR
jgi:hypothetical protein